MNKPTLIFLHGLLGSRDDWRDVIVRCAEFHCIALDLPYHGTARDVAVRDFDDCCAYLHERIENAEKISRVFLVGYSLGGRLALYYALHSSYARQLSGVIAEGANLGLLHDAEKTARWANDRQWAERFTRETPEVVLDAWYRQPVFAHLSAAERMALIEKRRAGCGANIGAMLTATSLAKQPYLGDLARLSRVPVDYVAGEKDRKFRAMAARERLNTHIVADAGHNAHLENPGEFAAQLKSIVANSLSPKLPL